jgi:RES domain-containing protein
MADDTLPRILLRRFYLAEDMVTALTEVVAIVTGVSGRAITLASGPWVIVAVHGVLLSILDLTIIANVKSIGSNYQELTGSWRYAVGQAEEPATHVLGRLCHQSKRFDGIRFPSSKNTPHGVCLAVFPDRLKSPAYLEVFDPQNNVPQRVC